MFSFLHYFPIPKKIAIAGRGIIKKTMYSRDCQNQGLFLLTMLIVELTSSSSERNNTEGVERKKR